MISRLGQSRCVTLGADRRFHTALISQRESHYQKNSQKLIDHFQYIKILTWLRGLGE